MISQDEQGEASQHKWPVPLAAAEGSIGEEEPDTLEEGMDLVHKGQEHKGQEHKGQEHRVPERKGQQHKDQAGEGKELGRVQEDRGQEHRVQEDKEQEHRVQEDTEQARWSTPRAQVGEGEQGSPEVEHCASQLVYD